DDFAPTDILQKIGERTNPHGIMSAIQKDRRIFGEHLEASGPFHGFERLECNASFDPESQWSQGIASQQGNSGIIPLVFAPQIHPDRFLPWPILENRKSVFQL